MKRMIFIVNPHSGKEQIKRQLLGILDTFCAAGYIPSVFVTQGPEDAERIVRGYGEETELLVCSGGDGTLNSVVSGLMGLTKRPRLGYLPAGSTNDFARSLKIPSDLKEAAAGAVGGETIGLDIGRFGDERYFVYIAAFGAFTEVSYTTPQDKKNVLGYQAYLLESVRHLASLKPRSMRLEWEDGVFEGEFIFGMISNTTSVGGFKGLAPRDSAFDDGLFEGMFIKMPKAPSDLAGIASCLFFKEEENDHVIRFKTSRLSVSAKEEIPWVLDGEFGGAVKETVIVNLKKELLLAADRNV
ncbi:MAG: YegS/Rv2252/BmrU family lipid kinase [Lachnospiraceae bacterium]|nr:YegS/Rv2252/BmrU family lipid kinase [Lachnospiraceae bacterium]